jgi:hypothetical protein
MEYLPGEPLDYRRDLEAAARLFARVHTQPVAPENNHLIREERPLTMTYEECSRLLPVYLDSELADTALRDYLREVLDWAGEERVRLRDPFNCLRGISWSAMAWVTYQTGEHTLQNQDTFLKVSAYLDHEHLKAILFEAWARVEPGSHRQSLQG